MRPAPARDSRFETNLSGCHVVGDVSGTLLFMNAANEGSAVMIHITRELHGVVEAAPTPEYDVMIVGAGPSGLSAAITAKKLGLRYVAVERDTVPWRDRLMSPEIRL